MIELTKVVLGCDPLLLMMGLLGAGVASMCVLLGVSLVVEAACKTTCPRCKRETLTCEDNPWI